MKTLPTVIDVREPNEFARGHVDCAINIPVSSLTIDSEQLHTIPMSSKIIVYCGSGKRAGQAKLAIEAMGYSQVTNGIDRQHVELMLKS